MKTGAVEWVEARGYMEIAAREAVAGCRGMVVEVKVVVVAIKICYRRSRRVRCTLNCDDIDADICTTASHKII